MTQKILIVDDVIKNVQLLGSVLGREGYAVSYALNGTKALEMCSAENFDLILLDIMMPQMDGFEVCTRLKQDPATKEIPIIFLTARSEHGDIVAGFHKGAADYLTKPFNTTELVARVKLHLSLREAWQRASRTNDELVKKNTEISALMIEKNTALAEIKLLQKMLAICPKCRKVRDVSTYRQHVEEYLREHSDADLSHATCPDCCRQS
ncbi:response regulator [Desulfopila aestuarii]|uniref:Response regulator receiver domain-containing protein n=1 Tax=Desulfopila aestuarii DSM 18488 TaxID=1121416 RepID=A0A1M7XXC5_9BACT|nr:response regulator [Desulfopila aestuarii]SHO43565.1 Response regulator receiver domain-containing protein [Desulfopila aestuarii DSM 18488]